MVVVETLREIDFLELLMQLSLKRRWEICTKIVILSHAKAWAWSQLQLCFNAWPAFLLRTARKLLVLIFLS